MLARRVTVVVAGAAMAAGTMTMWSTQSAAGAPQPAAAVAAVALSIELASPTTAVGDINPVTVTLSPPTRRPVNIQIRWPNQGWTTVDTVESDSAGTATGSWKAFVGDFEYQVRAVAPAHRGSPQVISDTGTVAVTYGPDVPPDDYDPMTPGRLVIRPNADKVLDLGDYRIRVDAGVPARGIVSAASSGGMSVRAVDGSGRVAWANDPGRAFVSASSATVNWFFRSKAGAFWPDVERSTRLTQQTITAARVRDGAAVLSGLVRGGGASAPFTVTMTEVPRNRSVTALEIDVTMGRTTSADRVSSVMLTSGRKRHSPVHGLGEQFRPFDLDGQVMPILVQEQGVTRGEEPAAAIVDIATWGAGNLNTTYAPWPTYVTGQKRSFELVDDLRSGAFSVADMRRPTQISLESFQAGMTARVLAAGSPQKLMAARGAGQRRPELANWIQKGAVLGLQGGTEFVTDVVADMRKAGTKISGVWLQDWVGKRVTGFGEQLWWTWQLNRERYPQWNKMVRDFRKQGIRTMTYINPFVIDVDEVDGQPVKNYWRIGERKGFLVKNRLGETYVVETVGFPTAMVDLTNPKARDWFADIVADNVLGVGASGFMADFGEYLPFDSVVHKGTAMQQHNRYPQLWAETVREGCKRGGVPDCVAFFRAGYTGSPKSAPLMWAGDQMVNYAVEDGLANAIKGMLAGGVSGAPLWHSDIGGYTSVNTGVENFIRPPDLNARWAEMQAFGPVMRSHETNRPRLNQQIYDTATTRKQFARASQIYAALHEYRQGVIDEGIDRGIPAMRHTWLVYPGTKAAQRDTQFFLGDHLFTAPVVSENAMAVTVTFPPGRWRHILTGRTYAGNRATQVDAPIGTPAAFVKVGDSVGRDIISSMKKAGLYR